MSRTRAWSVLAAAALLTACSGNSSVVGGEDVINVGADASADVGKDVRAADAGFDVGVADAGFDAAPDAPADVGRSGCRDNTDCAGDELGNRVCDVAAGALRGLHRDQPRVVQRRAVLHRRQPLRGGL
ncbi:MAG: hypothetical protein IPN17_28580 [Deltaproteobacteria bacterium]|nr:hypothetical protein [Deltaproteobacteria bacterium]